MRWICISTFLTVHVSCISRSPCATAGTVSHLIAGPRAHCTGAVKASHVGIDFDGIGGTAAGIPTDPMLKFQTRLGNIFNA